MVSTIHAGSEGAVFSMTLTDGNSVIDLTGFTVEAVFMRPDETLLEVTATIDGDPALGVIKYVGQAGDFDMVGSWRWQAHLTGSGEEWWSDVADFEVLPNL